MAPPEAEEIERALDLAEQALDEGDPSMALELCDQVLAFAPAHAAALYLSAESLRDLRELPSAEQRYRLVLRADPLSAASWTGLGAALFDQLQFDQAREALNRAIRTDVALGEPYHWRAMLRERRGDIAGAMRDFRRAWRIDPEAYPLPIPLDDATVEAVVEEAIHALHPSIREYLQEVAILLEEVPDEDLCRQFDPPAPPGEILGYFSGTAVGERSSDAWSTLPATIALFRRNLERVAYDRERMIEELRITVFHEVGHFLGLDEDDLEERGLD